MLAAFLLTAQFVKAADSLKQSLDDSGAQTIVRVALGDNNFKTYDNKEISIIATDEFFVYDKLSYKLLAKIPADKVAKVKFSANLFEIYLNDKKITDQLTGPLVFDCPNGVLGVENLKRRGKQAYYHGALEAVKKPNANNVFFLINVIELESYLKGVVPNEMPVKFGLEALKAQAVAARNYVLSPRNKNFKEFDVYDSVASQVYFGSATEDALSNKAIDETKGLVALYNWDLILAQYSSTAGGYSESYENAFSDMSTFPAKPRPYLTGKPDMLYQNSLENEDEARRFYMSYPDSYDMKSPYYRWQKEWGVNELEQVLSRTLPAQAKTGFVKNSLLSEIKSPEVGKLKEIKVKKRGVSGKIMEVEIITDKANYTIQKELVVRRVFQKEGISLPSANVVFEMVNDIDGNLSKIVAYGGGFGHGVGMSQYGAGFMSAYLNKPFDEILKRYYSGISISTVPIILSAFEGQSVVTQRFFSPKKSAKLVINNKYKLPYLRMKINNVDVQIPLEPSILPSHNTTGADISQYIKKGDNTITFYFPSEFGNKKALRLYVELVGKDDEQ